MRRIFYSILSILFFAPGFAQQEKGISGVVTYMEEPLPNVNILIKGTSNGTKTDSNGQFTLKANLEDIMIFSYVGMETVEVMVKEGTPFLNIKLSSHAEELNEVVVKKKRRKTQKDLLADYPKNKSLLKTNWGIIDKDRSSYSMRIFDGDNLIPAGTDFLASLQAQYPNMRISNNRDSVWLPNYSSKQTTAIFDVDGAIYYSTPTFLSVREIDRVAILTRNGAFIRYGASGVGGVIIVNTKEQTRIDELGVKRKYNNSALVDSIYTELTKQEVSVPKSPEYMSEYYHAPSELKAIEILEKHEDGRTEFPPSYYIDVSNYFDMRWENRERAIAILDLMEEKYSNDIGALRSLAFKYEEENHFEKALGIYLKILKLDSRDGQSHRDVANAYNNIGNYQKALKVYTRYERAVNALDTIPFGFFEEDDLMATESTNIMRLKGNELSIKDKFLEEEMENQDTRLVFEWNNTKAEFKLQFVNPLEFYDSWSNLPENVDLDNSIRDKQKGFTSKQFFLDETTKGDWEINIGYYGNQTKDPTYLKVTTYFDFGKPKQKMEIRVFKLSEGDTNLHLLTINNVNNLLAK